MQLGDKMRDQIASQQRELESLRAQLGKYEQAAKLAKIVPE